ncbi:hypothetical protein [Polymorphospora rubra]|uniref:DUF1440 domain-containing protein n=1 Tax=Polymorphospora rubra TaxID=338584 RepID=A0A810NA91_9ACTN|nr:hypothetical protein [Polymorphospora rubra]BCJ68738.1 hypothetical protein Prubr_57590 [Polymorphospora rubra]
MWSALLSGAAAGAAGTTALDAVTYLDMAQRGRPASSTPQQTVEAITGRLKVDVPGDGDTRQNRLTGLGALSGIGTGIAVGAVFGALRGAGFRPHPLLASVVIGLAAMAASDVPMAGLKVSDPRTWSAGSWLSDIVPHLAYGMVTSAVLAGLDRRGRR